MQSALAAAAAAISSMAWLMTIWSPAGSSAITPNCASVTSAHGENE